MTMKPDRRIYDLKLHECISVEQSRVMRVAGGWIYTYVEEGTVDTGERISSVFVPYSDEFELAR